MRTLRNTVVGLTVGAAMLAPAIHWLAYGAVGGLILCLWLWRYLLLDWVRALWHSVIDDLRKGP